MAETPRTGPIILRPNRMYEPKPTGSRVHHEHDMNDAINARIDWVENYTGRLKSKEEHSVHKALGKEQEKAQKEVQGKGAFMLNFIVWANIYAIIVIVVLKSMRII